MKNLSVATLLLLLLFILSVCNSNTGPAGADGAVAAAGYLSGKTYAFAGVTTVKIKQSSSPGNIISQKIYVDIIIEFVDNGSYKMKMRSSTNSSDLTDSTSLSPYDTSDGSYSYQAKKGTFDPDTSDSTDFTVSDDGKELTAALVVKGLSTEISVSETLTRQ